MLSEIILIPYFRAKAAAGTTAICSLTIMILLFFKIDKNIKLEHVIELIVAPLIGCIGIIVVCVGCKGIEHLWIRVIVTLIGSVSIYGILQVILKNELVNQVLVTVKNRIRR